MKNQEYEWVTYEGKQYPLRRIDLCEWGEIFIGTESLKEALKRGFGKGKYAEEIDQIIFSYVPDRLIEEEHILQTYVIKKMKGA